MENKMVIKEFRGKEELYILMSDEIMYINVHEEEKKYLMDKIESGAKNIALSEDITVMNIKDITELSSKKSSKDIHITSKDDIFAIFTVDTKEVRANIFKEIHRLLGDNYEVKEKKYSMFRRVITPACYTAVAVTVGAGMVWLATAQPELVKRDMVVKKSIALIINTLQFIEALGAEKATMAAIVLVVLPILYMAVRIIKPPVKIVMESK